MKKIITLAIMLLTVNAYADPWTGIIASDRAIDWSDAGATIVDRETPCTTAACNRIWCGINTVGATICDAYPNGLDSTSITAANINTAISGAPDNTVVRLPSCSRDMSTGINISRDNVTLRGNGANETILNMDSESPSGCPYSSLVCVGGAYANPYGAEYTYTWSDNFTKGTSTITTSATPSSVAVGNLVIIAQNQDSSDGGYYYVNSTSSGWYLVSGSKANMQVSKVTAKSGNNITIDPPVIAPNYASGKSPVVWGTTTTAIQGVGIETLRINNNSTSETMNTIMISWAKDCWVKGVMGTNGGKGHVTTFQTVHITIRDSYFYGSKAYDAENYGLHLQASTGLLVENNILQMMPSGVVFNGGNPGSVIAYNYNLRNDFPGGTWWPGLSNHDAGTDYILMEGNYQPGLRLDYVLGTHNCNTMFRNFLNGNDPTKTEGGTVGIAIGLDLTTRMTNVVGNVLGTSGIHDRYSVAINEYNDEGDSPSIYNICSTCSSSTMRWGNYDTYNNAVRWESSEVPSGITQFANPVPSDHTLPNSFYLSSKPSWFGSVAWPPIGSDVTGGDVSGWGGRVNKIPSKLCYDNTTKDGNGMLTDFNADVCYASSGGDTTAPTVTRCTVQNASSHKIRTGGGGVKLRLQ